MTQSSTSSTSQAQLSNISAGGSINLNANNNINLTGVNLNAKEDISLQTQEGDITISSAQNTSGTSTNYEHNQVTAGASTSGSVNASYTNTSITSSSSSINNISSNLTANNITINSGNNTNIIASNLSGNNGSIVATNNVNITSLQEYDITMTYHQHTNLSFQSLGALALQLGVAAGVGVLTGGAGFFVLGSGFGAGLTAGALAGTTATGMSHLNSFASHSAGNVFAGFMSGDGNKVKTGTSNNINSNLSFNNSLSIIANNGNSMFNSNTVTNDKGEIIGVITASTENTIGLNISQSYIQVGNTIINQVKHRQQRQQQELF